MSSRSVRFSGLSAVALVALSASSGLMLAACGSEDAHPLSADAWVLTKAVDHGASVKVPTGIRWQFLEDGDCEDRYTACPDGPKLVGNDVCNDFARSARFDDNQVVWGDDWWSTAVGCPGGLTDTLLAIFDAPSVRYEITGDQLRLISSDAMVELTFRASEPR